jgi:hypothetical protein
MLADRARHTLSCQEKTPAAGWQTRERVGNELNSADTLSYDENERGTHPPTIPHVPHPVNFILISGRTLGSPSKRASKTTAQADVSSI